MGYDYDWVSIGGGTAGEVAAGMAASLGARSAVIEADKLGGDCTWYGCMPSKTFLHLANRAYQCSRGEAFGIHCPPPRIDFARLMESVRGVGEAIYEEVGNAPSMARLQVTAESGRARFVDPHTVEITGADGSTRRLSSRYFLIATGSEAEIPPIPGLQEVPFLTNKTVFSLTERPSSLLIVGAGAIGLELGQAFHRLGTRVHVIDKASRILEHDDAEHAHRLLASLRAEGLEITLGAELSGVARVGEEISARYTVEGKEQVAAASMLLLATGRHPVVEGLGLEEAKVAYTRRGVTVDRCGRTSARHIFAAGDVVGTMLFTHMAENMAKAAVTTAILKVPTAVDRAGLTWCTYTTPEIGHLGETQAQLDARGARYETHRLPFTLVDRARTDFEPDGEIKVFATKWGGKILGVSILGARAGDMLCEWALARRNGLKMRQISDTIHPYPTMVWGVRRAADQWYVRRRPIGLLRLLQRLFGYRGKMHELGKDGAPL